MNAVKHGLSSSAKPPLVLPSENGDHLRGGIQDFERMAGSQRMALIESLVGEAWRVRRAFNLDSRRMDECLAKVQQWETGDHAVLLAHAWDELSCQSLTATVVRHTASARNRFRRIAQKLFRSPKVVSIRASERRNLVSDKQWCDPLK